jgi:biopolymer transport protein ExbD
MRHTFEKKKLARKRRKPSELLLVPMIDIFTVLVTFLLMTAVFSRTVILELNLPSAQTQIPDLPKGLHLEVLVLKDRLVVADRNAGPLRQFERVASDYDYAGFTDFLKVLKTRYPDNLGATLLLESDTPYDTLVQVMDRVRVFEAKEGVKTVQAELFPDISIGDAPT